MSKDVRASPDVILRIKKKAPQVAALLLQPNRVLDKSEKCHESIVTKNLLSAHGC
jgi:hypothetical protein